MKIVALSDFHGDLIPAHKIEECDVVCIAGDIVPLRMQRNIPQSISWLKKKFIPWVEELNCERVILVAGNHDFCFEKPNKPQEFFKDCEKIKYLEDSGTVYNGVSFFGTPWITGLPGWAFYTPSDTEIMDNIPNIDVLITHAPPSGQVGTVLQHGWNYLNNFGSEALRERLIRGNIKYCLSGHIHSGAHFEEIIGETKCYNVSVKDESYELTYPYRVLEI